MTTPAIMLDQKLQRMAQVPALATMLATMLAGMDASSLADLEDATQWYGVAGGTTIVEQGAHDRDVFVLLSGRLGVFVDRGMGPRLVHHAVAGEIIGEMALVSHEPRSATIVALHDSEVLRIPAAIAERVLAANAGFMAFLLAQFSARLKTTTYGESRPMGVETVAVVPVGQGVLDAGRPDEGTPGDITAAMIADGFRALGGRIVVRDARDNAADDEATPAGGLRVAIARDAHSARTLRAIRQADRVLFVARAGTRPDARLIETLAAPGCRGKPTDLMLINPAGAAHPLGGRLWLGPFAPDQIFHVAADSAPDHARIARLTTGRAVGVVLAGGGARGFAHVGAIRALTEAGIPIDLIGGTSMGAIVGGSAAFDVDLAEVERKLHDSFVLHRPVGDYTVPLVALARGRRMSGLFFKHFGDADILDCWRTFFAVSTNLSTAKVEVHREGLLRRALRASSSLPGIVPPVVVSGQVLVDGGLMNNFPIDVMAAMARGRVVGIDVAAGSRFHADEPDIESRSLAWMLGPGRSKMPNIGKLLMRSGMVASERQCEANRKIADLVIQPDLGTIDLLSFGRFREAIDAGYHGTRRALAALAVPFV